MTSPTKSASASAPNRSIDVARLSLETDTSDHSYTLRDLIVPRGSSYQARMDAQTTLSLDPFAPAAPRPDDPARSAFADYRERMSGGPSRPPTPVPRAMPQEGSSSEVEEIAEVSPRPSQRLNRVNERRTLSGPLPLPLRVSIDLPKGREAQTVDAINADGIQGRIVRRRRRLPLPFIIFFGCVSCFCAVVASAALFFGAYNFSIIRQRSAAYGIINLRSDLFPMLSEILQRLNGTRS